MCGRGDPINRGLVSLKHKIHVKDDTRIVCVSFEQYLELTVASLESNWCILCVFGPKGLIDGVKRVEILLSITDEYI